MTGKSKSRPELPKRSYRVRDYLSANTAPNTQLAYRGDIADFLKWGGGIPSTPAQVARYLVHGALTLKPATLSRRVASISTAHRMRGIESPTHSQLVRSTLRGIRRIHGAKQRQASPLLKRDVQKIVSAMKPRRGASDSDRLRVLRDAAILLTGFAGGFRCSELVAINVDDVEFSRLGMRVTIRRAKSDQEAKGRTVIIPRDQGPHCAVKSLRAWLERAEIDCGPIFRGLDRHGNLACERLSAQTVTLIVKDRVQAVGFDPKAHSGHSLRAGLVTSAVLAGTETWKIRMQTGHRSEQTMAPYIRIASAIQRSPAILRRTKLDLSILL